MKVGIDLKAQDSKFKSKTARAIGKSRMQKTKSSPARVYKREDKIFQGK